MAGHYKSMPPRAYGHPRRFPSVVRLAVLIALASTPLGRLSAAELYENGDVSFRWDTTVRVSEMFRVDQRDAALLADPNADDGDRDFAPGLVSNRLDVFSQADLNDGDFGLRLSGQGWYDSVYTERNDNNSPSTFNPVSVPHNAFTRATRELEAEHVELSDAYLHGSFSLDDMPVSFRLGRHTLIWGESLFFAENGIAAGQSPVDVLKALGEPQAQTAEILLPVTQASATFLPRPDISVDLYYQFEWRKDRLPGVGSYFSEGDILDAGGERLLLGNGAYLTRMSDLRPPGGDQFGAAVRFNEAAFNYGFYAMRFDAKTPEIYLRPDGSSGPGSDGSYQLVYPRGIELYGASFSSYIADSNVAGEISYRRNMPLVSLPAVISPGEIADADGHARYAVGDTLHAQVSSVSAFGAGKFWDGASLTAEIAASNVLNITKNRAALDPSRDRTAASFEVEFEPEYFEVLPNLDIRIPIGLEYGVFGDSATAEDDYANAGNLEIAVEATFRTNWEGKLAFTHFLGSPVQQPLADRDFVSISLQRTF